MSRCGRELPYRQPRMDLSRNSAAGRKDASAVRAVMPSRIAWPCRSRRSIGGADQAGVAHAFEGVVGAGRAGCRGRPPPRAGSASRRTGGPAASFAGLVSTATITEAPAMRAPWMTLRPMPPVPMTTHAVAAVHPGPVEDRADAGQHPAADQRRRGQRNVLGDLHRLDGLDQGAFRERRVGGELVERRPAARERAARHADRLAAHRRPAPVALRARPAVGERGQRDVVARAPRGVTPGAHRLHHARALVPEHHRHGERDRPVDDGQVASGTARPPRRPPAPPPGPGPVSPGRRRPRSASRRTATPLTEPGPPSAGRARARR